MSNYEIKRWDVILVNNQRVPLAPDQYNTLKDIWEKRINILKQIKEKDGIKMHTLIH